MPNTDDDEPVPEDPFLPAGTHCGPFVHLGNGVWADARKVLLIQPYQSNPNMSLVTFTVTDPDNAGPFAIGAHIDSGEMLNAVVTAIAGWERIVGMERARGKRSDGDFESFGGPAPER